MFKRIVLLALTNVLVMGTIGVNTGARVIATR